MESHRDDCFSQAAPHKPMTGGHGLGASQHPMSAHRITEGERVSGAHGVTRGRGRVTQSPNARGHLSQESVEEERKRCKL